MQLLLLFVTLCAALAAAAPPTTEDLKKVENYMAECMKLHGVSDEEFGVMVKSLPKKPEDVKENIKCAEHCFMVKHGYMDEAGVFDAEKAKEDSADSPDKERIFKTIDKCKLLTGDNKCDNAFLVLHCIENEQRM